MDTKENTKIAHLHVQDGFGNKRTLICSLKNGAINYTFYGGINSEGMAHSLNNLQCNLPIEKLNNKETLIQFRRRLINVINSKSVVKVIHIVEEVKF